MIRIDEIYNNTFLPVVQSKPFQYCHFFDPFGSTNINDLCSLPVVDPTYHRNNFLFWDQEPIYKDIHLEQFEKFYSLWNKEQDHTVLITSEYNSEDVNYICNQFNWTQSYYFFHGWAALDWYRGYDKSFLYKLKNINYTYLFPNNIVGGRRQHRLELFRELEKRNLVENNLVSLPSICPYENRSTQDLCEDYNLGKITSSLPLTIDEFDNYAYNSHQINMWTQSSQSLLQIVGETVFYGNKQHLTEKTFKPIVLQQPFVLASCRGSLEYLRSYGFETFSSVWDESYDQAEDNARCSCIASLLEDLEYADKQDLHEQCAPIVEHNYNHFYGGGFEKILWNELTQMISQW